MDTVVDAGGSAEPSGPPDLVGGTWDRSVLAEPHPSPTLEQLVSLLVARHPDDLLLVDFARHYWGQVADTELEESRLEELYGVTIAHWEVGRVRAPGTALLDVRSPEGAVHSLLLSVCDDAPFLVDSVRIELDRQGVGVHLMVLPQMSVVRDAAGAITAFGTGGTPEAWTLIVIDRCDRGRADRIVTGVRSTIADVLRVVGSFAALRTKMLHVAADLRGAPPKGVPSAIVDSVRGLLDWLVEDNLVFLAAADYDVAADGTRTLMPGSELGLPGATAGPAVANDRLLAASRADTEASVYRHVRPTCVAIRHFDTAGTVVGESRFLGLFSAEARRVSVTSIPYVRDRVDAVIERSGYVPNSHAYRALRNVLETFPRDELFEMSRGPLFELAMGIVALQDRQIVRVFAEAEPAGPWVTVLVYLPAKRFEADVPQRVGAVVAEAFGAQRYLLDASVGAGALARITVAVRRTAPDLALPDLDALAEEVDALSAPWDEFVRSALVADLGEQAGLALHDRIGGAVPFDYAVTVPPEQAIADLERIDRLAGGPDGLDVVLVPGAEGGPWRMKLFRAGPPVMLADTMPLFDHLGLRAVDERPFEFRLPTGVVHLYDIGVEMPAGVSIDDARRADIESVFAALFAGTIEGDGFNRLVAAAGLDGRQVEVLRSYGRYLRQIRFPFSQQFLEDVLYRHPQIAAGLVALFEARFDPARPASSRDGAVAAIRAELLTVLDGVPSLDDDRVGRMFLALIDATLRTNAYRPAGDVDGAGHRSVLAFKLDPTAIPDLPKPRPRFEIWICSPTVEGVHLRGGLVARGGIRASDRREDFRTEVLGLVKAQMVKNAVIVPVGAKGGFVSKRPPAEPDAIRADTEACYRLFIAGLLDVTDNIVRGATVHPPHTVCYDGDDPYLVVAADKGTATFSDVANSISADYSFWLGDAFASGGSVGYDHKEMGITARGAWESVRRHARTIGKDADRDELTLVGIGDMSGDVFGNGLLMSPHVRLVAAFDHRHVFLDPRPDPAASYAERRRLFELPRSSWADYDSTLISAGGGVFARTAKHIAVSPEAAAVLGIEPGELAPTELMSAILRAPVDVLWNGGIGTYVKAATETHADVGDRANDALRIDGNQLRCRIVGEGGNLGFTQRGRVEYALNGGLINTDAIDNSAGVDCSDHEVNIKILLAGAIDDGALDAADRPALLASMTDEVAQLVLADNEAQTLALAVARRQALPMANVHARYLHTLEAEGWLDRALEFLPTDKALAERQAAGQGLTTPEFAVMLAYTKTADVHEIIATDLPDDPYLAAELVDYFPTPLRERFRPQIDRHRLRREIVATRLVNEMVNQSGISFDHRMTEETGASVADIARAWAASRDVHGSVALWQQIEALDSTLKFDVQIDLFLEARRMVERSTLWLLRHRRPPIDIGAAVAELGPGVREVQTLLHDVLRGPLAKAARSLEASRLVLGVPDDLALASSLWPYMHTAFDIVDAAGDRPVAEVATAYWALFDALDVTWLWDGIGALPRNDRWQTQSRSALRDDLLAVLIELTSDVVDAGAGVDGWLAANERPIGRLRAMFTDINRTGTTDLTALTVGVRQLRNLVLSSTRAG
jgi:glutamate dehydrogenase